MSSTFNPSEPGIFATDDEAVAKAHGLNWWDEDAGQYVKRDVTEHGDNADPARENEVDENEIVSEHSDLIATDEEAHYATPDDEA